MKPKKTKIKIKHKQFNLYNKKKSKAKQALTVILTIVAACVLGVVGYGIGKPVMDYLRGNAPYTPGDSSDSGSSGTPDSSENSSDVSGDQSGSSSGDSQTSSESTSNTPAAQTNGTMYLLPDGAAANSAALNSAIAAAKSTGCTTVVATLKDSDGIFLYKTGITGIKDSSVTGTLTAAQICEIITKAGLTPAAKISTIKDKTNGNSVGGNYNIAGSPNVNWIDAKKENGGKLWLSPFKDNTVKFIGSIAEELSAAGFKHIICTNTMYPLFHSYDISNYLRDLPLTDSAKRTAALWNVLDSARSGAAKNGAQLWIEVTGEDLLKENKSSTDAELCLDTAKLKDAKLILDYTSQGDPADAYKNAQEFAAKAKAAANGAELSITVKGFSASALADSQRAFNEAGFPVFSQ